MRRYQSIIGVLIILELTGCSADFVPARFTRPEEAEREGEAAAAAEKAARLAAEEKLAYVLAHVRIMSGDSVRPYEVLGSVTSSGDIRGQGFVFGGVAFSSAVETPAFDRMRIQAFNQYGDRVDAVIGVVCQGLTCTGTAVHWRE